MRALLVVLVGTLIVSVAVSCGSTDEESGAAASAQVTDLSEFPTPTRSQAAPPPASPTPVAAARPGPDQQSGQLSGVSQIDEQELEQLRQRLQSGELSPEEAQAAIQRLRSQIGGGDFSQAVGSIAAISQNTLTVSTELATVTASVGDDTNISVTSMLDATALVEGSQVMVVSERVEGISLARVITLVPEGDAGVGPGLRGFGGGRSGAGGPGGGQNPLGRSGGGQASAGAAPLVGTIGFVGDGEFTLETQQGPLPILVDEDTLVVETRQGALTDLEAGMRVRVTGPADESGRIEARSIVVTPEGFDSVRGLGGG